MVRDRSPGCRTAPPSEARRANQRFVSERRHSGDSSLTFLLPCDGRNQRDSAILTTNGEDVSGI